MKLTNEELSIVNNFITSYREINNELTGITNQLQELSKKQQTLTEELIHIRRSENDFAAKIKSKYGEGTFNLETLEYQLKN